jgi:hypothetical protein
LIQSNSGISTLLSCSIQLHANENDFAPSFKEAILSLLSPKQWSLHSLSERGRQWSGGRTDYSFSGLGADLVIACDFDPSLGYRALKTRKGMFFSIVFVITGVHFSFSCQQGSNYGKLC